MNLGHLLDPTEAFAGRKRGTSAAAISDVAEICR